MIREMRLVQLAHGGLGFKRTWTRSEFFGLAIRNGRAATGAPGTGGPAVGAPADFVVIDLDRLDRDAIMPVDPLELLFARGNASVVRDVVVDGRTIVRDGQPTGVDLAAIEQERKLSRSEVLRRRAIAHACLRTSARRFRRSNRPTVIRFAAPHLIHRTDRAPGSRFSTSTSRASRSPQLTKAPRCA